jgi:hypothetical protein
MTSASLVKDSGNFIIENWIEYTKYNCMSSNAVNRLRQADRNAIGYDVNTRGNKAIIKHITHNSYNLSINIM